jgi:rhodanese-related sulfurtransferase
MTSIQTVNGVAHLSVDSPDAVRGYKIIDVRMPEEFTGDLGHIEGATLSTLGGELQRFLPTLSKDDKYLFVCKSGGRSTQASLLAMSLGFKDVTNLAGGMLKWNELGLKTER